jgi:hypothetical protein
MNAAWVEVEVALVAGFFFYYNKIDASKRNNDISFLK